MCIILLWRQHHNELFGKFKFILAANRDEYFRRPAKRAQFWESNEDILAGEDMTEGVEGGIWIGVNRRSAKIGALTNLRSINQPNVSSRSGRGQLIRQYLSSNENASQYLKNLSSYATTYRPFNLIVGDLIGDLFYLKSKTEAQVSTVDKGFVCLTNDALEVNSKKKEHALEIFTNALHRIVDLDDLETHIYEVLQDKKINYPEANVPGELDFLSSVFVGLTDSQYGTRTHTIIAIDKYDHVTFIEKTKLELDDQPENWFRSKYEFDIK